MSNDDSSHATFLLSQAKQALIRKDRLEARRLASTAAKIFPQSEEPWLILAALAGPHARIGYLIIALKINPHSQKARQAIHLTIKDIRSLSSLSNKSSENQLKVSAPNNFADPDQNNFQRYTQYRTIFPLKPVQVNFGAFQIAGSIILGLLIFIIGIFLWGNFSKANIVFARAPVNKRPVGALTKPTLTPTTSLTPTLTPILSVTQTPLPTSLLSPISTEVEYHTPTLVEITPTPSSPVVESTQAALPTLPAMISLPSGVQMGDHWIDIDLSDQTLFAYEGDQLIRSFSVSTGTEYTPTVSGLFKIYVKYEYADMYGPGYYLPAVPFVMYFHKDYGIHGAYWHMNFGTPMSHGCVNLRIEDAGWLFDWSSVGNIVNIHE